MSFNIFLTDISFNLFSTLNVEAQLLSLFLLKRFNITNYMLFFFPLHIIFYGYPLYKTLVYVLLWHLLISLPIFYALSKKIKNKKKEELFKSHKHPFFILTCALGVIYPMLWGLFLSCSRYVRLGTTYNIYTLIADYFEYIILFIFTIPCIGFWACIIFNIIIQIRNLLWNYTENMVYSFHVAALQYYDYFFVCRLIHKSHFILYDIVTCYPGILYRSFEEPLKEPFLIKIRKKLNSPITIKIIHGIVLSTLFFEIIINKGNIYYGLYTMFLYPTSMGIINIYKAVGSQDLILNMCLSDYLAYNFKKPRYSLKFWFFAKSPTLWYGFEHLLSMEEKNSYNKILYIKEFAYANFMQYQNKLPFYVHGYRAIPLAQQNNYFPRKYAQQIRNPLSYNIRLAAYYKCQYGVKWYHTTRVLHAPTKNVLHPFTYKFIRDPYTLLALLNQPGQNLINLQQITKNFKHWPQPNDLYTLHPNIKLDNAKTLTDVLEANFVMRFQSLAHKNIILGTYYAMKAHFGHNTLETMQMRPDMVSNWILNVNYSFKGYLAMDEKHKVASATNEGRHQVINSISTSEYVELLIQYEQKLQKKYKLTEEIRAVLLALKT